jgi:hypothetical protein
MLKLLQIIAFRDQCFFHNGQKRENSINIKILDLEYKISTIFSFMLGVVINACRIMNQFHISGEFTISNERPPNQWNLEKKNDGQALPAWPSSALIRILPQDLYGLDDLAEHVTDCRTKNRQNDNDNDGDQNQNQCILYKTLAFPLQFLEHVIFLLSERDFGFLLGIQS